MGVVVLIRTSYWEVSGGVSGKLYVRKIGIACGKCRSSGFVVEEMENSVNYY